MEEKLAIFIVIGVAILLWALIDTKLFFSWGRGADLKDEMVRQYGAPKAWLILFLATLVLGVIFLVMTTAW